MTFDNMDTETVGAIMLSIGSVLFSLGIIIGILYIIFTMLPTWLAGIITGGILLAIGGFTVLIAGR